MDTYIFVRLMGGLGNQLFQYAAGLLQKKVTNGIVLLEKVSDNKHDSVDYRSELFTNAIPYNSIIPLHISLYQEDGFKSWNPDYYTNIPILYLYGYFQNYSCLKPILPEFKDYILKQLQQRKLYIKEKYNIPSNSAFIHIRRGDYVDLNLQLKDFSYYQNGVKLLPHIQHWYKL